MEGNQRGKASQFFGQFADPGFYVELAQTAIREVIKAAALALAGALTYHVQRKFQNSIESSYQGPNANPSNSASAASRAFGVQDTTNYSRPSYSSGAGAQSFPGFGSR